MSLIRLKELESAIYRPRAIQPAVLITAQPYPPLVSHPTMPLMISVAPA